MCNSQIDNPEFPGYVASWMRARSRWCSCCRRIGFCLIIIYGFASNLHRYCQFKIVTVITRLEMATADRVSLCNVGVALCWCTPEMREQEGTRAVKPGVLYRYAIENELWKSCFILHVQLCTLSNAAEDWLCLFVVFCMHYTIQQITPIVKSPIG